MEIGLERVGLAHEGFRTMSIHLKRLPVAVINNRQKNTFRVWEFHF